MSDHKMSQKFSCAVGGQQNAICGADDSMTNGNTFVFCQQKADREQIPQEYYGTLYRSLDSPVFGSLAASAKR